MDDPLLVDRPDLAGAGDQPAHMRIGNWLEQLIVSRALAPGDKLPSEVEIANALGVSRMTLRQALSAIEAKGLIDRRRGRSVSKQARGSCAPRPAGPRLMYDRPSGSTAARRCMRCCARDWPTASRSCWRRRTCLRLSSPGYCP